MERRDGKNIIFLVTAPSGAGKTHLVTCAVQELNAEKTIIQRVRSFTTRNKRIGETDDAYDFQSIGWLIAQKEADNIFEMNQLGDNFYGHTKSQLNETLRMTHAINDVSEHAHQTFKDAGYEVRSILIVPKDTVLARDIEPARARDDDARREIHVPYDLIVENHFRIGGAEQAVKTLVEYIRQFTLIE